jgi:hypothetical protein
MRPRVSRCQICNEDLTQGDIPRDLYTVGLCPPQQQLVAQINRIGHDKAANLPEVDRIFDLLIAEQHPDFGFNGLVHGYEWHRVLPLSYRMVLAD